jgi:hypothetical protein
MGARSGEETAVEFPNWMMVVIVADMAILAVVAVYKFTHGRD